MAKEKKNRYTGTGRRKTSIARVTLTPGTGKVTVNGRDVREYFPSEICVMDLMQPLVLTNTNEMFDVDAKVKGGGFQGQTGAIRLGITKALLAYDSTTPSDSENGFRKILKVAITCITRIHSFECDYIPIIFSFYSN